MLLVVVNVRDGLSLYTPLMINLVGPIFIITHIQVMCRLPVIGATCIVLVEISHSRYVWFDESVVHMAHEWLDRSEYLRRLRNLI